MATKDIVNHVLITNKRLKGFSDISDYGVDVLASMMEKYAREKCLKAVKNTRYKAYDLLEEWCDAGNPNVKFALNKIENIQNQDVMPEI